MRTIKFRAWDGKRMTTSGIMFNSTTGCLVVPDGSQMKLMQFTGLHDKNGVPIYEGDIVKWGMHPGSSETFHRYAKVCINPDIRFEILFYVDSLSGDKKPTDNFIFNYGKFAYKNTDKHLEVIGNIHSNPELL
jgi:uncharacterized phage protein (TIGR01671 family)